MRNSIRLAIVICACWLALWVSLFDAVFTLYSMLFPLLFSSTSVIGPYWLYLKHKRSENAGPGPLALTIWLSVALGTILAWRNDPGDWNLTTFVTIHSIFSTPAIVLGYLLWRITRWLNLKRPRAATALKLLILSFTALVAIIVVVAEYGEMQALKPSSTQISSMASDVASSKSIGKTLASQSVAAVRFGDAVIFGTTAGLLGWRISESSTLAKVLNEVPDASMFADMERGRLLLIKSTAGVFCTEWGIREALRVEKLPRAKSLFRAGRFAWVASDEGELFRLESPTEKCEDLQIAKADLSDGRFVAAAISGTSVLFVACKEGAAESIKKDCSVHHWYTDYSPKPPQRIANTEDLVSLTYAHGRVWIVTSEYILVFKNGDPFNLSRIDTVGRSISRVLSLDDGLWVESGSGSWLWSETTSSFTSMLPISRLESYGRIGDYRWASSKDGVYRWKATERRAPSLVAADIGPVKRYVEWNGCVWLGATNGLYRVCDARPNNVERLAKQAATVDDLVVAGWEKGVPPNTHPSTAPDILWAATDVGVLRFSKAAPDDPALASAELISARLLAAGDYLWMSSVDRFLRWKLDATADIEPLDLPHGRWLQVCTDMTAAWFIGTKEIQRIPEVQSPSFWLDWEYVKRRQFKPDDGSPGESDARYWNCQDFDPPSFPQSYMSRATVR